MMRIKKGISIKVVSIIIAGSFIITSNVYPDTFSGKPFLRKPLDFNNSENTEYRYVDAKNTYAGKKINGTVEIQTKEEPRKTNNISPIRRVMLGGLAASLSFLSVNLIRYFVIAPNYLEPLRYGSAITAVILAGFVIFLMLPEVFIGRSIFSAKENKGSKIRLVVLIAAMLSLVPNIFFVWQGNNSMHYIRHEIVTPMIGNIDKPGEFTGNNKEQKNLNIRHSMYTVDHNLGGIFKEKETVHVILVPQESGYKIGIEAIEGKVPFKKAIPDRITENDSSVILKASGGYSEWDPQGANIWNASLVIKNGNIVSEYSPSVKTKYILVITDKGKMIIALVEDYINAKYPFDGSEKDLNAIHAGFSLMINGYSTGLADTLGDIEQNRSWGIVFQCVDKNGKRNTGFFYSSGVVKGISGTPLPQIYKFLTETFAVEYSVTVTDVMVMESGGFNFIDAELPDGRAIHGGSGEARATSVLVVRDPSLIKYYGTLVAKAEQSPKDFYDVYMSADTMNISGFLKAIETDFPGQINKLLQGLTDEHLLDLLNKSISVYPYRKQQILTAFLHRAGTGEKQYVNMLERFMLEAELSSTELINTATGIGAGNIAKEIVSKAVNEMVVYKIGYYRPGVWPEIYYGKGDILRCNSLKGWASLGIEVRDERNLKTPISLYGKQMDVRIKNNGDQYVRIAIQVRSTTSASYSDLVTLKEAALESHAANTIYIDEAEILNSLGKRGYDIENISVVVIGPGDIELQMLSITDTATGAKAVLLDQESNKPVKSEQNNTPEELRQKTKAIQENQFSLQNI